MAPRPEPPGSACPRRPGRITAALRRRGSRSPGPRTHEPGADRERFAILRFRARELEALHLGERHLRAVFDAGGAGRWVAP